MIKNYDNNNNVVNLKKIECILKKKCISILFNAFVYLFIRYIIYSIIFNEYMT